tara:strand:- start:272 stop:511 length:240 start_codon:yes stop_codon:yes gene_type:complete
MKPFTLWCVDNGLAPSASSFKKWRSLKLQESDWMDLPTTPAATTEWANYRQSLRDLPANAAYPLGLIDPKFIPLDPNGE